MTKIVIEKSFFIGCLLVIMPLPQPRILTPQPPSFLLHLSYRYTIFIL